MNGLRYYECAKAASLWFNEIPQVEEEMSEITEITEDRSGLGASI
jgi:hypothetical protein